MAWRRKGKGGMVVRVCRTGYLNDRRVRTYHGTYILNYIGGICESFIRCRSWWLEKQASAFVPTSSRYAETLYLCASASMLDWFRAGRNVLQLRCPKLGHEWDDTWQQYARTHVTSPITGRNPMAIELFSCIMTIIISLVDLKYDHLIQNAMLKMRQDCECARCPSCDRLLHEVGSKTSGHLRTLSMCTWWWYSRLTIRLRSRRAVQSASVTNMVVIELPSPSKSRSEVHDRLLDEKAADPIL